MPQIAQIAATYASQIFWLLIVFGLIYFVIGKNMLPKIEATVDARDRKIADDLATALAARAEADEIDVAYHAHIAEARAASAKAMKDAKTAVTLEGEHRLKDANAELAVKAAAAEAALQADLARVLDRIEDYAAEAAQDLVAKVSGLTIDPAAAKSAVKTVLANS